MGWPFTFLACVDYLLLRSIINIRRLDLALTFRTHVRLKNMWKFDCNITNGCWADKVLVKNRSCLYKLDLRYFFYKTSISSITIGYIPIELSQMIDNIFYFKYNNTQKYFTISKHFQENNFEKSSVPSS